MSFFTNYPDIDYPQGPEMRCDSVIWYGCPDMNRFTLPAFRTIKLTGCVGNSPVWLVPVVV